MTMVKTESLMAPLPMQMHRSAFAETIRSLVIGLTAIGLSGLGIPYVLPIGMWGLAAGTAITLYQRMRCGNQGSTVWRHSVAPSLISIGRQPKS